MSHEIRTPMNAILGMLQLLQNTHLSASQADYVNKTQGAAKSLLGILNDILDFSKVEAGKMQLDPEPCVLDEMMRELSVIMSSNLGQKKLELLFDIDPELPTVLVFDALRLKQVLINLTGNAIKFTAQGEVLVRVSLIEKHEQHVRLHFVIKDSGIGISPENQQRIFEGFSQAEASTSRRFGGTGLGLAISSRLVALMGGELQIESTPGVGSMFHFEIQVPCPASEGIPVSSNPLSQHNVLLLAPNPLARSVHGRQLRSMGCFVDSADSLEQAWDMAQARKKKGQHYDALLLDQDMDTAGCESLAQKLHDLWPQAPVWARTVAMATHDVNARGTGSTTSWWDAWLVKPFTPAMLTHALNPAQEPRLQQAPASRQGNELQGLHILLVEDNPINQQVASELLRLCGATVSVAGNGQEALDHLHHPEHGIDVVLMDMQMPVMDGLQATQAIRQKLGLSELPIIAMTANAMPSDKAQCLSAGMNDHIGKPFDIAELVRVLLHWTGKPALAGLPAVPSEQPLPSPREPRATPADQSPDFDPQPAIARLGGDPSFFGKLLDRFLTETDHKVKEVAQAWRNNDPNVTAACHTLKGSAATLGMTKLAETAAEMETLSKTEAGNPASEWPADRPAKLRQAADAALRAAQAWRTTTTPPEAPPPPAAELDTPSLRKELLRLNQLLSGSDMESLEVFDRLSALPGCTQLPHWSALSDAVESFDFEGAANTVGKILREMSQ
jgi:CheY-like chemotaxis protein